MKKSLGNKRNKIGDPGDDAREPDQIADVTPLYRRRLLLAHDFPHGNG